MFNANPAKFSYCLCPVFLWAIEAIIDFITLIMLLTSKILIRTFLLPSSPLVQLYYHSKLVFLFLFFLIIGIIYLRWSISIHFYVHISISPVLPHTCSWILYFFIDSPSLPLTSLPWPLMIILFPHQSEIQPSLLELSFLFSFFGSV